MARREIGATLAKHTEAGQAQSVKRTKPTRPVSGASPELPFDVLDFREAYRASSADRIVVIKAGIPAKCINDLAIALRVPQDAVIRYLGFSISTINRKAQANDALDTAQSESVLGISMLIGLVQTVIDESDEPDTAQDFDAAIWFGEWLSQPNQALGGALPSAYLDTYEGRKWAGNLIGQMQSGAYA